MTALMWGYLAGLASALALIIGVKGARKIKAIVRSFTNPYPGGDDG